MKPKPLVFVLVLLAWVRGGLQAQPDADGFLRSGLPAIQVYTAAEFPLSGEVFALAQVPSGLLYVGTTSGVFEHDGQSWRRVPAVGRASVLAANPQGDLALGAENLMAVKQPDVERGLVHLDALKALPKAMQDDFDPENVFWTPQGWVWVSSPNVHLQQDQGTRSFPLPDGEWRAFAVQNQVWLHDDRSGIYRLHSSGPVSFRTNNDALLEGMVAALDFGRDQLLAVCRQGLRVLTGRQASPLESDANAYLADNIPTCAAKHATGFAIGTQTGGLVLLDRRGNLKRIVRTESGLPDNLVRHVLTDREGNLWVAMPRALAYVVLDPNRAQFGEALGLPGRVNALAADRATLYAGTSLGLFQRPVEVMAGKSRFVPVAQATLPIQEMLFVGDNLFAFTADGILKVRDGFVRPVFPRGVQQPQASAQNPNRFFAFSGSLVLQFEYENGELVAEDPLGLGSDVESLKLDDNDQLWAKTVEGRLLKMDVRQGLNPASAPTEVKAGLTTYPNPEAVLLMPDGLVRLGMGNKVLAYAAEKGRFEPDPVFTRMPPGKLERLERSPQEHWVAAVRGSSQVQLFEGRGGKQGIEWRSLPGMRFAELTFLGAGWPGLVLAGHSRGLVAETPDRAQVSRQGLPLALRSLVWNGRSVTEGYGLEAGKQYAFDLQTPRRELQLELVCPVFERDAGIEYEVLVLEDGDTLASGWSARRERAFTLRWGEYRLELRARNADGRQSAPMVITLRVPRPWYLQTWVLVVVVVCLVGASVGVGGLLSRRRLRLLERDRQRLNALVEEKTRELRENQQLMLQAQTAAILGRITPSVAHELNTPLGGIRAAGQNVQNLLPQAMLELPLLMERLDSETKALFWEWTGLVQQPVPDESPRERRARRSSLEAELDSLGLRQAETLSDSLANLGLKQVPASMKTLLKNASLAEAVLAVLGQWAAIAQQLAVVQQGSHRAQTVLAALRAYTENTQPDDHREAVDVVQSLDQVLTVYNYFLVQHTQLERRLEPGLPPVWAHPHELLLVWTHLLAYVLDAVHPLGPVLLEATRQTNQVVVHWHHKGKALPNEALDRELSLERAMALMGEAGVALVLAREHLKEQGAELELRQSPQGTHLWVRLPARLRA